jgi:dienelactone hydrolase
VRGENPPAGAGLVLVLHGGRSESTDPVTRTQLTVLRMIPLSHAIRRAVAPLGGAVRTPLFSVRGWNGASAAPVADLARWLDDAPPGVPVVLVGHSMGARAALRAAGHPRVIAVAGLAPWLPPGEPVAQLAGRRVLLAHGDRDHVTSPAQTWAYAARAASVTDVTAVPVPGGDHAMLRRARQFHALAAGLARDALAGPAADRVRAGAA